MNFLTLANIKAQARVDNDYEDSLLTHYGEAAEAMILNDIGYTYAEVIENYTTVPEPLIQAGYMLTSTWYKHRENEENVSIYAVPFAYEYLIKPYMKLTY